MFVKQKLSKNDKYFSKIDIFPVPLLKKHCTAKELLIARLGKPLSPDQKLIAPKQEVRHILNLF